MSEPKQPVGLLLIATRKYKGFVLPLLRTIAEYFLTDREIKVFLFTDDVTPPPPSPDTRLKIFAFKIPSYGFPEATLFRYKSFTTFGPDIYQGCSHLFYLDVDMRLVAPVGDEILGSITATQHPGFYRGGGSWGNMIGSEAYTEPGKRKHYFAGGFQGGDTGVYFGIMELLRDNIDKDEQRNLRAEWHDETHWNWYLAELMSSDVSGNIHPLRLDPSYCMVEEPEKRKEWGIDQLAPRILALAKNHEELRRE